ncbi:hypothetical protein tb265_21350 [Gemmatimonadetes bacterium T265]|nr:hypothetical protein tb265_21350 [Gemmatimonadetes bacterium T265]
MGQPMNRRDALKVAALLGAAVAAAGPLAACGPGRERAPARGEGVAGEGARVLDADDQALVDEIADTLLPATAASPGAKAAGVGAGANLLLTGCYEPDEQRRVVDGLRTFRAACLARHGAAFAALAPGERAALLREVDAEARRSGSARAEQLHAGGTHGGDARGDDAHYFGLIRELAERAYFTSEVGATRALRYVREPGRWAGCVPLAPGQPAWA